MKNTYFILLLLSAVFVLSGCSQKQVYVCSTGEQVASASLCPVCGDGKCTGLESDCNCPNDCYPEPDGKMTIATNCPDQFPLADMQKGGCSGVSENGQTCTHYTWNN